MISFLWCHRCCYSVDLLTRWTGRMVEGRLVRVVTACLNEFELSCLLWPEVFFFPNLLLLTYVCACFALHFSDCFSGCLNTTASVSCELHEQTEVAMTAIISRDLLFKVSLP